MSLPLPASKTSENRAALRRAALVCLFVLTALASSATAEASPARATFALDPLTSDPHASYFVFDSTPGATIQGRLRVINTGSKAGRVLLYSVDSVTGQTTGAVYLDHSAPRSDVGAWTRPSASKFELGARSSRIVSFSVRVPRAIADGQHLGGIVVEDADLEKTAPVSSGKGSFQVRIRALTIAAVQVNLPGARRASLLPDRVQSGGSRGYQSILVGIRSNGNRLLKGSGSLVVTDSAGKRVQNDPFTIDTFVPRTRIDLPVPVRGKAVTPGHYRADVKLFFGGRVAERIFDFTVSNEQFDQIFKGRGRNNVAGWASVWLLIAGAIVLLLAGFGVAWALFRRKVRRLGRALAAAEPERPSVERTERLPGNGLDSAPVLWADDAREPRKRY